MEVTEVQNKFLDRFKGQAITNKDEMLVKIQTEMKIHIIIRMHQMRP